MARAEVFMLSRTMMKIFSVTLVMRSLGLGAPPGPGRPSPGTGYLMRVAPSTRLLISLRMRFSPLAMRGGNAIPGVLSCLTC